MNTLAAAFVLVMNIENPPFAGGPAIIEGFGSEEACHSAAATIEESYGSIVGPRNNFRMTHDCVQIQKTK